MRRRPLRNRRSARLARISVPPQHSVYPAVLQNDNHRCREQHRTAFPKTRCHTSRRSVAGVMPARLRDLRHTATWRSIPGRGTGIPDHRPARAATAGDCRAACPDRRTKNPRLRSRGRSGRLFWGILGSRRAGHRLPGPRNEGVGEHVRIRFHMEALGPGEIADQRSAPNEENLFPLPDRSGRASSSKAIQPFDLMSRRHPLSSTRAAGVKSASRSKLSGRLV